MQTAPLVILFAERHPGPGRRLRMELRRRGAKVFVAVSTEEAIHQAALAPPDLLVMDDDLAKVGPADLGAFMNDAFPGTGIIFLHGSGPPTTSPSGLDLLLWAHKHVAEETLIETMVHAFPGRLGAPSPDWVRTLKSLRALPEPTHPKSLAGFLAWRAENASRFRGPARRGAIRDRLRSTGVPEGGDESAAPGPAPSVRPEVHRK